MEENNFVAPVENPTPPIVSIEKPIQKNGSGFLIFLLSTLLIIAVLIAGFFAYQTQSLVRELTDIRTQPSITPKPTTPSESKLETYTDEKYGFTIKYPEKLVKSHNEVDISKNNKEYNAKCADGTYTGCGGSKWPDYKITFYNDKDIALFDVNIWKGDLTEPFGGKLYNNMTYKVDTFRLYGENGEIEPIDSELLKQISETLSFNQPVACTAEAKLCPDGSSVGRSGPKCEFSPCPTALPL